jgi:hypothetical protein
MCLRYDRFEDTELVGTLVCCRRSEEELVAITTRSGQPGMRIGIKGCLGFFGYRCEIGRVIHSKSEDLF